MIVTVDDIEESWEELSNLIDYCSMLVIGSCDKEMADLARINAISEMDKCIALGANYALQEAKEKGLLTIN